MCVKLCIERIKRLIDETECDLCGCPLRVWDRVAYDLASGAAYCGKSCAARDDFPVRHERDIAA